MMTSNLSQSYESPFAKEIKSDLAHSLLTGSGKATIDPLETEVLYGSDPAI